MSTVLLVGVASGLAGVILGYLLARLDAIYTLLRAKQESGLLLEQRQPSSFFAKKHDRERAAVQEKIGGISIDTSTFVTEIKTDTMQKVNDVAMGKTTTQSDTINQSVSKLAQLKGK